MHRKAMVRLGILALVISVLLSLSSSAAAKVSVHSGAKTTSGKAANLVTLSQGSFTPKLITAGGFVTSDTDVANFISTAKNQGTLLAMVNGAYFNAYYNNKTAIVFPNNCPATEGALISNGRMIHSGGSITLGYTTDGKWLIDKTTIKLRILSDGSNKFTAWGVNVYYSDSGAISVYTPEIGRDVPVAKNAYVYVVRNGVVESKQTGRTAIRPAAGTSVIVFGAAAYADTAKWGSQPEKGSKIEFTNDLAPSRDAGAEDWKKITMSVTAGPILLLDGKDVSGDKTLNSGFTDAKHQGSAQRTFIGVKADNSLVIGTASTTYADAASTLKAQGCVDAMALDGGASSFLYADGKTLQSPGRKLNNVIAFFETSAPTPPPTSVLVAKPTASAVLVNGSNVSFDAYGIGGNNYFKLRDLAYVLSGSEKQFDVSWDAASNAISLIGGQPYTPVGGEMTGKGNGNQTPKPTTAKITLNGKAVSFAAYNIGGNNYFKLRDIGQAFDFGVQWDGARNTIVIDTSVGYTPE